MSQEKKTRKKRPIYFICIAVKNGQIIDDQVEAATEAEASQLFEKNRNVKPTKVKGPFYEVKGIQQAENRITVSVKPDEIDFTGETWNAVFRDWKCILRGLAPVNEYKANELVRISLVEAVKEGAPKPKFGGAEPVVPLKSDLLSNIEVRKT